MILRGTAVLLLAALAGCGYSTGLRAPDGYTSLGLEPFKNESLERDVERELHVAMTEVVRDRVDVRLAPVGAADLVLRGTLLDYRFQGGVRSRRNELLERGLVLHAEAHLWDPRRGETVGRPVQARTQVGYALDDPFGEAEARRRALAHLAERLVLDLLSSPHVQDASGGPSGAPRG